MKEEINKLCVSLGKSRLLVQGSGGNVSWKKGLNLYVKASGKQLKDANKQNIFVKLNLESTLINLRANRLNLNLNQINLKKNSLRPSIETAFHAIIPSKIIVHLHAVEVMSYLIRKNAKEEIDQLVNEDFNWKFISYAKPGAELAKKISDKLEKKTPIDIFFLENHGIIVCAQNLSEIKKKLKIIKYFKTNIKKYKKDEKKIFKQSISLNDKFKLIPIKSWEIQLLALNQIFYKFVISNWALFPDHVVFLGSKSLIFDSVNDVIVKMNKKSTKIENFLNKPLFIKDIGVFSLGRISKTHKEQILCYFDVVSRLPQKCEIIQLTQQSIKQLINWEAEKYRINLIDKR